MRETSYYETLASLLPEDAVWIVTNLIRTSKTADAIWSAAGGTAPTPIVEPEFAEQFFGDWEGLTFTEIKERNPDDFAMFWQDPSSNAPPGGESFSTVIDRTSIAVDRLTEQYASRDIICVAHGGSIRGAVCQALNLHHERGLSLVIDNLSLTRLDHVEDGGLNGAGQSWRVNCVNMTMGFMFESNTSVRTQ